MTTKSVHAFYLLVIFAFVMFEIYSRLDLTVHIKQTLVRGKQSSEYNISVQLTKNMINAGTAMVPGRNSAPRKDNDSMLDNSPAVNILNPVRYSQELIKIALYYPFHILLKRYAQDFQAGQCAYKNCRVNIIKSISKKPVDADAVIFQGNRMPKVRPTHKNSDQVFVFQTLESPVYVHYTSLDQRSFADYFNWTMTYRLDSDIFFPYGAVIPRVANVSLYHRLLELSDEPISTSWSEALPDSDVISFDQLEGSDNKICVNAVRQKDPKSRKATKSRIGTRDSNCVEVPKSDNTSVTSSRRVNVNRSNPNYEKDYKAVFQQKSNDTAWLVSHCSTASKREEYAKKMSKYMKIDIYGECSTLKCPLESQDFCVDMVVRNYRFYLAFENSMCTDYITEKAFLWFDKDIILVVRGGRSYTRHFPKGTYIDTSDFSSTRDLAQYLNKLGSNEEEYVKFLQRKDKFRVIPENERLQTAYCRLCRMLNDVDKYRKTIPSIKDWWEKPGICIPPKSIRIK